MRRAFWLLLAAALAVYLAIMLWSLPRIVGAAGGLPAFDMRPLGYSAEEARTFLAALSPQGRDWYLGTQHLLDLIYPGLMALTFAAGFLLLYRGPVRWGLVALALCVAVFDWLENLAVAGLLRADPAALDPAAVAAASRWTLLKSAATTLAWVALLGGAVAALLRRRRA